MRRARDRFGNGQQILQIERGMPAGIEFAIANDADVAARSQSSASAQARLAFRLRRAQCRHCPASSPADRVAPDTDSRRRCRSKGASASLRDVFNLAVASISPSDFPWRIWPHTRPRVFRKPTYQKANCRRADSRR